MPFADDEHPVSALSADGPYEPFRISVHPGSLGSSEQHVYAGCGEHGVEGAGEFAVPVPDQMRETMSGLAVAVPVTGGGSTSWSPCGGASAATFQGSRPGASASPSAASGTTPRAWPDRSTRAAAWGSPGAARRPPGAGPESRCPSTPTTEPAAPARTAPRHRTGRSDEPARWPIIAGPSWWPSCRRTTGLDRGERGGWGGSGRRAPPGRAETREAGPTARSQRLNGNPP